MSCRSTPGSSAMVSLAMAVTGLDAHEAQVAFHDLRREGAGLPRPAAADVAALLAERAREVRLDPALTEARRDSLLDRLDAAGSDLANGRVPDGPTFRAWQRLLGEAQYRDARRPLPPYPAGTVVPLPSLSGDVTAPIARSRFRTCRCCAGTVFVLVGARRPRWKTASAA